MRSEYMLTIAFYWSLVMIATVQIDQKLIGFWQFDGGKGSQATDVSGNKFQGKMIGKAGRSTPVLLGLVLMHLVVTVSMAS